MNTADITTAERDELDFPTDGGELGKRIREFDWSKTSLGPISGWPQSLKTATNIVLQSPVPMVMLWGPDGVMIYNDAYAVFAGGRHPRILGSRVVDGWPEAADFNANVVRTGLSGGTLAYRDQHFVLHRPGVPEDCWLNLDYSPVPDESGRPGGVLAIVVETTQRVLAERRQRETEAALRRANERIDLALDAGAVIGTWVWDIRADRFTADERFARAFSLDPREAATGLPLSVVVDSIHPDDEARVVALVGETVKKGGPYRAEYRVRQLDGSYRWIEANGRCEQAADGTPLRFPGVLIDIEARKRLEAERERANAERQRLSAVAEQSFDFVGISDPRGRVLFVNKAGRGLVGIPEDADLSVYNITDFFFPEDRPFVEAVIKPALFERGAWQGETRFRHFVTGAAIQVFYNPFAVTDEAGRITALATVTRDITEQKRSELALRESEERFRMMADSVPALIWATDDQARFIFVNRHHETVFGVSRDSMRSEDWRQFVHKDDVDAFFAKFREDFDARRHFVTEVRVWNKFRELRWLRCDGMPRLDGAGRFLGYVGCNVDITETRLAADAMEAEIRVRTRERDRIWQTTDELLIVVDVQGRIKAVNPAWMSVLGWSEAELLGMSVIDLEHPDERESTRAVRVHVSGGGRLPRREYRFRHKNGSYRWISWTAVPDDDLIYAVGRDVTEERKGAEALRRTEDALRQAQKMEAVGQLTGGIAHDFNNLLTGIIGNLALLQRRMAAGRTDNIDRFIDAAVTSANRAASLTHRLLAFSRRQSLDPKPVDVNRLVSSMEDLLRRTLGENIALAFALKADLWTAEADDNQLESALLNLVINARDAMPNGGRLTVETANFEIGEQHVPQHDELKPGDYVVLCVRDTGVGMAPATVERAFDPFFTTKPIGQGTGLGLSMIYGFAKQSKGHVRIDSDVGHGTTVTLYLPRCRGDAVEEPAETGGAPRAQEGETVLVVEDDPAVRLLMTEVLQELGYRAVEAEEGRAALAILETKRRVDLLITDVGLPGMNGRQLAEIARQHRPELKVLFVTGYAEGAAQRSGFLDKGMEMIAKPFAIDDLAARIRAMIEGDR